MNEEIKNVTVIGAGAMGCLFAARMAEAGAVVTLIDVDSVRLDTIVHQGLELSDDFGTRTLYPKVSLAAEFVGPVDLVVLFTKGMHSRSAVKSVAHLAAQLPIALTLQNGVGNAEVLAELFGRENVVVGTAMVPADLAAPNKVTSHGFAGLKIGGFCPEAQAKAGKVAGILEKSRFKPVVTADVNQAVWEKLAFNAALNAVAMITLANNGELDNPYGRRVAELVVDEALAVGNARGMAINRATLVQQIDAALRGHPDHEASMLQDRRHGRPTEIDTINGAIVARGGEVGVLTPVNEVLAQLVRLIESRRRSPHAE